MPGIVKVKVVEGRNLPVMDKSGDTTDAYVELKLGNITHKTEVCRKTLNPIWNSDWYRFEMDDAELQDEPLQVRLMDHDTYSANDMIGKVYFNLNPLLINTYADTHFTSLKLDSLSPGSNCISGWFPVYDTIHGLRGDVYIIIKLELFSDLNKFRQSSCGVQLFCSSIMPFGYNVECIFGFVEELVVEDDPEYQWIEKIRTPRASNEARQSTFYKMSGELQRKIGVKVIELGGNAIIGYRQCFDLEGESGGVVVRGIGTAVKLERISNELNENKEKMCSASKSSKSVLHKNSESSESMDGSVCFDSFRSEYAPDETTSRCSSGSSSRFTSVEMLLHMKNKNSYKNKFLNIMRYFPSKRMRKKSKFLKKTQTDNSSLGPFSLKSLDDDSLFDSINTEEDNSSRRTKNSFHSNSEIIPLSDDQKPNLLFEEQIIGNTDSSNNLSVHSENQKIDQLKFQIESNINFSNRNAEMKNDPSLPNVIKIPTIIVRDENDEFIEDVDECSTPPISEMDLCDINFSEKILEKESRNSRSIRKNFVKRTNSDVRYTEGVCINSYAFFEHKQKTDEKICVDDNTDETDASNCNKEESCANNFGNSTKNSENVIMDLENQKSNYSCDEKNFSNPYNSFENMFNKISNFDNNFTIQKKTANSIMIKSCLVNNIINFRSLDDDESSDLNFTPQENSDFTKEKENLLNCKLNLDFNKTNGEKENRQFFKTTRCFTPPLSEMIPYQMSPVCSLNTSLSELQPSLSNGNFDSFSVRSLNSKNSSKKNYYKFKRSQSCNNIDDANRFLYRNVKNQMGGGGGGSSKIFENMSNSFSAISNQTLYSYGTISNLNGRSTPPLSEMIPYDFSLNNNLPILRAVVTFSAEGTNLPAKKSKNSDNSIKCESDLFESMIKNGKSNLIRDYQFLSQSDLSKKSLDSRKSSVNSNLENRENLIFDKFNSKQSINHDFEIQNKNAIDLSNANQSIVSKNSHILQSNDIVGNDFDLSKEKIGFQRNKSNEIAFFEKDSLNSEKFQLKSNQCNFNESGKSNINQIQDNNRKLSISEEFIVKRQADISEKSIVRIESEIVAEELELNNNQIISDTNFDNNNNCDNIMDFDSICNGLGLSKFNTKNPSKICVNCSNRNVCNTTNNNKIIINLKNNICDFCSVTTTSNASSYTSNGGIDYVVSAISISSNEVKCESEINTNNNHNFTFEALTPSLHTNINSDRNLEGNFQQNSSATDNVSKFNPKIMNENNNIEDCQNDFNQNSDDSEHIEFCKGTNDANVDNYAKINDNAITEVIQNGSASILSNVGIYRDQLDMMEYPFLTLSKYPKGFIMHLGGTVSARSVKVLDRISNSEESETRDAWWTELRIEIKSHMKALACNVVLNYTENTSICDEVCILSACGTAAVVQVLNRNLTDLNLSFDCLCNAMKNSSLENTNLEKSKSSYTVNNVDKSYQTPVHQPLNSSGCSIFHIPYRKSSLPFPVKMRSCCVCSKGFVPDMLFATVEPLEDMPMVGHGAFIHAFVYRLKKDCKTELNAREVSDSLPFLEYELNRQLVNKLRVKGMNSLFGLNVQISVGEKMISAYATGMGIYLSPLPPPPDPTLVINKCWGHGSYKPKLEEAQKKLRDAIMRNKIHYKLRTDAPLIRDSRPSDFNDIQDQYHEPDLYAGSKHTCIIELDDEDDVDIICQLLDPHPTQGFLVSATENLPGVTSYHPVNNIQLFAQVWRNRIPTNTPPSSFNKLFYRMVQGLYCKVHSHIPCSLNKVTFKMDIPEPDELQICVIGMAMALKESEMNAKTDANSSFSFEEATNYTDEEKEFDPLPLYTSKKHATRKAPWDTVELTSLSYIPDGVIKMYLGNLNFIFIRESSGVKESGGVNSFVHNFLMDVTSLVRSHVMGIGGNGMVGFFLNECSLVTHKNQIKCEPIAPKLLAAKEKGSIYIPYIYTKAVKSIVWPIESVEVNLKNSYKSGKSFKLKLVRS